MKQPIITVIGSINMDMVTSTKVFPQQGETVLGESFATIPGGKGANQAVAAARLGANVRMIGRVGDDPSGSALKQELKKNGIVCDSVEPVTDSSSGIATILLSEQDNRIIVTPGANKHVTPAYVDMFHKEILASDLVLLQLEIPLETVEHILDLCSTYSIPVILNPAPAQEIQYDKWQEATYITPNESEMVALFGEMALQEHALREKLIVTRGKDGASFFTGQQEVCVTGYLVESVDTTGAGDTFNGALAVAIAEGKSIEEAVRFANAAAALSVQAFGAQGGMPSRKLVTDFMQKRGDGQ